MSRFSCDPKLTGELTAEYEALQNDLQQAKNLAADYEHQLNDKSNDYAALKATLEKTTAHLEKLQANIVALRAERHKLANEVMRVVSLEAKLAASKAKNEELMENLRWEREKSRRECAPGREDIDVGFDDLKSIVILPTPVAPHPFKTGPSPRG